MMHRQIPIFGSIFIQFCNYKFQWGEWALWYHEILSNKSEFKKKFKLERGQQYCNILNLSADK